MPDRAVKVDDHVTADRNIHRDDRMRANDRALSDRNQIGHFNRRIDHRRKPDVRIMLFHAGNDPLTDLCRADGAYEIRIRIPRNVRSFTENGIAVDAFPLDLRVVVHESEQIPRRGYLVDPFDQPCDLASESARSENDQVLHCSVFS